MTTKVFYNLTNDLVFKDVFSHQEVTSDLLNSFFSYLNEEKEIVDVQVSKDHSMYGNNKNEKVFIGDILAVLNTNELASLKMYTSFGKEEYLKSVSYLSRLFAKQLKKGSSYKETKPIIGINFMSGNYHNDKSLLVNDYGFIRKIEKRNKEDEVIKMYLIRLDLVSKIVYTKDTHRLVRWLKLMTAKSLEEMKEIGDKDKIMEDTIRYVENFLKEEGTTFQDKIDFETSKAFNNGEEIGLKKGREIGKRSGILETAKKMLLDGLNIKSIMKYTGLSKEELENISNEKE